MGFRISFIAAEMPAEALASALGMAVTGQDTEMPEQGPWVARLKPTGFSILWSEDELFGHKNDAALLTLSKSGTVLNCIVNETVMSSTVFCYQNGALVWDVHWQGDQGPVPENLSTSGTPPESFKAELARQAEAQAGAADVDFFFEIAPNLALEICGFRHDRYLSAEDVDAFHLLTPARKPSFFTRLLGGRA